jgi:DNA-3-methyladenine glycosylase II
VNHAAAHRHLAATDPRIARLIARSRRYDITPSLAIRPFEALAESIAYQQLSGKAAATIWGRVRALYPRKKYLDPKLVLATTR